MNEETLPTKISRLQKRINICEAIYSDLIWNRLEKNKKIEIHEKSNWSDFEWRIYKGYIKNKKSYLNEIDKLLRTDWEVYRLNLSVLAIILEAISEYSVYKTSPAILIQQSFQLVKNYGEDEYKFVHAVIDNYIQKLKKKETNN